MKAPEVNIRYNGQHCILVDENDKPFHAPEKRQYSSIKELLVEYGKLMDQPHQEVLESHIEPLETMIAQFYVQQISTNN